MRTLGHALREIPILAAIALRAVALNIRGHLGMAAFSLVAAFALWMLIQDIDNPRTEGRAPASGGIQVVAVNVPDGYLVDNLPSVTVRVEAREGDLPTLRSGDFRAEVDLADIPPGTTVTLQNVSVVSRRDGVDVLEVTPRAIEVTLIPSATRELPITYRVIEPPPSGFRILQVDGVEVQPVFSPATVIVTGRRDLVERVNTVEMPVSLANARTDPFVTEGDLVARSQDGNLLSVELSARRARATFRMEEVFSTRTLGLEAVVVGRPPTGYRVTEVTVDPLVVQVTGRRSIIDGLRGPLPLEAIDVTNATETITTTKAIERVANVSFETQSALVVVTIEAVEGQMTFFVAVNLTDIPAGLALAPGTATVAVQASGPVADLLELRPSDFRATLSLSGASAGMNTLTPQVTGPPGIRLDAIGAVTVTLVASP